MRLPGPRRRRQEPASSDTEGGHFLQEDCPDDVVEVIDATAKRAR
jgi:hypothetical protein